MYRFTLLVIVCIGLANVSYSQQTVPFRDENTYKLELKMDYKKVPPPDTQEFVPGQNNTKNNTGFDFYITLQLHVLTLLETDFKLKCENNRGDLIFAKKLKKTGVFTIDAGRMADIKAGKTARKYTIEFLNSDKKAESVILLEFNEHNEFLVNNVVFGKI